MPSVRILDTAYLWGLGGVKTRRVTGISGVLEMFYLNVDEGHGGSVGFKN